MKCQSKKKVKCVSCWGCDYAWVRNFQIFIQLKGQFPKLCGLQSTLLQEKAKADKTKVGMLQIVHCTSQHHWIVTTTIGSKGNDTLVFNPMFQNVDEKTNKLFLKSFPPSISWKLGIVNHRSRKEQRKWFICHRLCYSPCFWTEFIQDKIWSVFNEITSCMLLSWGHTCSFCMINNCLVYTYNII